MGAVKGMGFRDVPRGVGGELGAKKADILMLRLRV